MSRDEAVDIVRCAYGAILGRTPDASGETTWTADLLSGRSTSDVFRALLMSEESQLLILRAMVSRIDWPHVASPVPCGSSRVARLCGQDASLAIRRAYRAVLDREPDEVGLRTFQNEVGSGRLDELGLLVSLLTSSEGRYVWQQHASQSARSYDDEIRGISGLGLFDIAHYETQVSKTFDNPVCAVRHYVSIGGRLGLRPHPLFHPAWYLQTYGDIAAAKIDPFFHFCTFGTAERRSPSVYFDTNWYLDTYADVRHAGINPLLHYVREGWRERRDPSPVFSTAAFLADHPGLEPQGRCPLVAHSETSSSPEYRPQRERFVLDRDYALASDTFAEWRRARLYHVSAADRRSRGTGEGDRSRHQIRSKRPSHVRIAAMVSDIAGAPVKRGNMFETCLRRACDAVGISYVDFDVDSPNLPDRNDPTLVVFAQDGDDIDPAGLMALVARWEAPAGLYVFDSYFETSGRAFPMFLPGANAEYLTSVDATFSRFALSMDLFTMLYGAGRRRPREMLLGALEIVAKNRQSRHFIHIPAPVLKTTSLANQIKLMRRRLVCSPTRAAHLGKGAVSVVICTKDKGRLLDQLLSSLAQTSGDTISEIVIVENATANLYATETHDRWRRHRLVRIISYPGSFNFSEQCNLGAAASRGELLLFMNDDIVPVTGDWLKRLATPFVDPDIGATGPLLLYPNETVQHAGMFLGYKSTAGHTLRGASLPGEDYMFMASTTRAVSCVTGAVLMMRRTCFDALGGFDRQLPTILQDVDMCLRIRGLGLRILFVPGAALFHMESVSFSAFASDRRSSKRWQRELERFHQRHGHGRLSEDEFSSPCLQRSDETLRTLSIEAPVSADLEAQAANAAARRGYRRLDRPAHGHIGQATAATCDKNLRIAVVSPHILLRVR